MTDGLAELAAQAKERLPEEVWRYVSQGSGDGTTAAEAEAAWRAIRFLPHVLRDVSSIDLKTTVLGSELSAPIAIGPTTLQGLAHPEGEIEMARGAREASTLVCVSSNSGTRFADVAATGASWWLQAYIVVDRGRVREMLAAAVEAGAGAVVLTVDTPVVASKREGRRSVWDLVPEDRLRVNLGSGSHEGLGKAADLTPASIGWLADETGLPVVVKGILRPDDARIAVDAGAAAVWVSNHGGRQLDRSIASADALRPVADEIGDDAEVYVDGGIRGGLDILAGLALGARAAFVARPAVWALAVSGAEGVRRLIGGLSAELVEALRLTGVPRASDVPQDIAMLGHPSGWATLGPAATAGWSGSPRGGPAI